MRAQPSAGPAGKRNNTPWFEAEQSEDGRSFAAYATGWLFGWPWLDPIANRALRHWYFPLSRLWAAADQAGGDVDRFFEGVPLDPLTSPRYHLRELLARFEQTRAAADALDAAWRQAFFAGHDSDGFEPSPVQLSALESARLDSRHRFNSMRAQFRGLLRVKPPRIRHDIPGPDAVGRVYDRALADPSRVFAPPATMPAVEVSHTIARRHGRDYWLKFKSPSPRLGDEVFARVHEPAGVENPPTLIFGHGVCVEFDHWRGLLDEAAGLVERGIRVIRPEAPWHGRRRPCGQFGGEQMIAAFPLGNLDLVSAAVQEWSVLADWARRTSTGPVAFGGSSLGALTAQLAADRANLWPAHLRPKALLLITHCSQFDHAIHDGDLMTILGGYDAAVHAGWTQETVSRYLKLLAPAASSPIPPDRIVTILGTSDRITPFESGERLIEGWRVPEDNRFILNRGHFSVPVTLMRHRSPMKRFREVLAACS